ncbi:MAG: PQQ-binding-like beta-propeller repeat protein [Fibrobacteres bacterium]|nr:PQQ-binding-like beta-propeller repeat protein [Fibrobacterota bacterium]
MKHRYNLIVIMLVGLVFVANANWPEFQGGSANNGYSATFINPLALDTIFKMQLASYMNASPIVMGDTLYAACTEGQVYAVHYKTGRLLWQKDLPGGIEGSPAADAKRLYLGARNGVVYALDRFSGNEVWHFEIGDTVAGEKEIQCHIKLQNGRLYFGAFNGMVYCLDTSGLLHWTFSTHFYIRNGIAVQANRVVVASQDGALYCLQDTGEGCVAQWIHHGLIPQSMLHRAAPLLLDTFIIESYVEAELSHKLRVFSVNGPTILQEMATDLNANGFAGVGHHFYYDHQGCNDTTWKNMYSIVAIPAGDYLSLLRSNAPPIIMGAWTIHHSSVYPKAILIVDRLTGKVAANLALSGYSISSPLCASDEALFFGTYEKWVLGLGSRYGTGVSSVKPGTEANQVLEAFPNPFNPKTAIKFLLAKDGPVTVTVFNVKGQQVWANTKVFKSGHRSILWNAKDGSGKALPTGVYFVKLNSIDKVAVLRVVLAR